MLGVHGSRCTLVNAQGATSLVLSLDDNLDDGCDEMILSGLQAGEFFVFFSDDYGELFNTQKKEFWKFHRIHW